MEAELEEFLSEHATDRDAEGRRAVVRNGYQPEREVLTGIGAVQVQVPKTRDRAGEGRCFRSALLPPYLKKAKRLEAVFDISSRRPNQRSSPCLPKLSRGHPRQV